MKERFVRAIVRMIIAAQMLFVWTGFASAENLVFPMTRARLEGHLRGMPLMEGWLSFRKEAPAGIRGLPTGLSGLEYAEVLLAPGLRLIGIRGADARGTTMVFLDRNTDGDFSREEPLTFQADGGQRTAVAPISFDEGDGANRRRQEMDIVLIERKPGKIEYHFDVVWDAVLRAGSERLKILFQRFPIMGLDVHETGVYDKLFFVNREVLALGGRFYKVEVDFSEERVTLKATDQKPIDAGYPAPDFEAPVWKSEDVFKLSNGGGKTIVLSFWSPRCPGSKAEAALYSRLAEEWKDKSAVDFIAVISDEADLANYLKDHRHSFRHIVSQELWRLYGVTAPFVTFVIDGGGIIRGRFFGFSPEIGEAAAKVGLR